MSQRDSLRGLVAKAAAKGQSANRPRQQSLSMGSAGARSDRCFT
jgi:hypothetical protein